MWDDPGRRIDLAHEQLVGGWPKLRAWIDAGRAAERARRRLEDEVEQWQAENRGLLNHIDLARVEKDRRSCLDADVGVPNGLDGWIQGSKRRLTIVRRWIQGAVAAVACLAVAAMVAAGIAGWQWRMATSANSKLSGVNTELTKVNRELTVEVGRRRKAQTTATSANKK